MNFTNDYNTRIKIDSYTSLPNSSSVSPKPNLNSELDCVDLSTNKSPKTIREKIRIMFDNLINRVKFQQTKIDELSQQNIQKDEEIKRLEAEIAQQKEENFKKEEEIAKLKAKVPLRDDLLSDFENKLDFMLENPELNYDWSVPSVEIPKFKIPSNRKVFRLDEIKPFERVQVECDSISTKTLKKEFEKNHKLDLKIGSSVLAKPITTTDAFLDESVSDELSKTVETDLKLAYGKRINWSNRKIARDIMQNFYDGHGNTLDGVEIHLEQTDKGKTKVKISAKGMYDYKALKYIGSGSKEEDLHNAGGYGEGAKVLVANLIGKGDCSEITYSCADWRMTFADSNGVLTRRLDKTDDIQMGNSLEFETSNQDLIQALIDSVNYFNHSENPDFQNPDYCGKEFGFKILDGNKKGNLYITQRFEYIKDEAWENSLSGITLFFNSKPDAKKYKKITGENLPPDRDRKALRPKDIENLVHYFAIEEMRDEDIIKSLLLIKDKWGDNEFSADNQNKESVRNSPLLAFAKGLLSACEDRKIAFDIQDEKFVCDSMSFYGENKPIQARLKEYGYKILPSCFDKIAIPEDKDKYKELSVHQPIEPTFEEKQKIKLLSEAVEVISQSMQEALLKKIAKPCVEIPIEEVRKYPEGYAPIIYELSYQCDELKELYNKANKAGFIFDMENLSKKEQERLIELANMQANKYCLDVAKKGLECDSAIIIRILKQLAQKSDLSGVSAVARDFIQTTNDFDVISEKDAQKPVYVFDRKQDVADDVLGESIVEFHNYKGHWVDKEYLDNASFNSILGTWLHEISHKTGADGTPAFTYALTDLIKVLLSTYNSQETIAKLALIEEKFNSI